MRGFISTILFAGLFLLIAAFVLSLVIAIISGVAVGVGWALTKIYPFSLFEGTIVGMFSLILASMFLRPLLDGFSNSPFAEEDEDDEDDEKSDYKQIASSRFFKSEIEKTWTAWLNYEFANDIYMEFQDNPSPVSNLSDMQTRELAVRLAEIGTAQLQNKTKRATRLNTTVSSFKKEMAKQGQRSYADDILKVAVPAINFNIEYYYEELLDVIRDKRWDDLAPDMVESES